MINFDVKKFRESASQLHNSMIDCHYAFKIYAASLALVERLKR